MSTELVKNLKRDLENKNNQRVELIELSNHLYEQLWAIKTTPIKLIKKWRAQIINLKYRIDFLNNTPRHLIDEIDIDVDNYYTNKTMDFNKIVDIDYAERIIDVYNQVIIDAVTYFGEFHYDHKFK